MAASLDGFIARKDGSVDWLETADEFADGATMEPEFVAAFLKTIDCYVMGSRTYETALRFESQGLCWVYGDKPTFVLTTRELPRSRENVEFYSGDLATLVNARLRPSFRSIWFAGGGADRRRHSVLREARQGCRSAPCGGQRLQERHGGASLRGAGALVTSAIVARTPLRARGETGTFSPCPNPEIPPAACSNASR